MDIINEVSTLIGQREGVKLEYKAVLPPSRMLAQLICAFANSEGGIIILGVVDRSEGELEIIGLSEDFHANDVTHKAIDLLTPTPIVNYQYINFKGKRLYVIKVGKSDEIISIESKIYKRIDYKTILTNPRDFQFKLSGFAKIKNINTQLEKYKTRSTNSKMKLITHFQTILKIIDDSTIWNYQIDINAPTYSDEGKLFSRILYSSFVDNFETYLSDLLYEIFLAIPSTLKSQEPVTVEEILNCTDLQEFIKYWANKKIQKLQKGSIKGFIKETSQIDKLGVIDDLILTKLERYLQIRHLYTHRNGIIDEKFLQYFPGEFTIKTEHSLSINEFCDILIDVASITNIIDLASIDKYHLSTL
jgi:hypothetical protein